VPLSEKAEGSEKINVLNAQEVFLEDVGHIHLESHQNHSPFITARIVFLLRRQRVGT
jgi:hypothetical protein